MNATHTPATTEAGAVPSFDPQRYKETTRAQWQNAADAWHRYGETLASWLGPATERMLDLAQIGPGAHVLDVAAGAGEQTLRIAARVGREGRVLATDIAPKLLAHAAEAARRAGHSQVETLIADGEALAVPAGSFDAVVSRVGLIYFPDQHRALRGMHAALRPGGRVAAIVYSTADKNQFFSTPVSIIRRRAGLPAPVSGQPGPFSLGATGTIETAYERAGFQDIRVERVAAPLRMHSASDCVRFERESFGALHQMLAGLDAAAQEAAWQETHAALREFENATGFEGPCELVIAVGTKAH